LNLDNDDKLIMRIIITIEVIRLQTMDKRSQTMVTSNETGMR